MCVLGIYIYFRIGKETFRFSGCFRACRHSSYYDYFHIAPGSGGRGDMHQFRAPQASLSVSYDNLLREAIIGAHDKLIYERTMDDLGISFVVVGEIPGDVVGVRKGYDFLEKRLRESAAQLDGEYRFDNAWANRFLP